MVLEGEGAIVIESTGQVGCESRKGRCCGAAVKGDDTGLAASVEKGRLVVGAGNNVSTVATHEAEFCRDGGR